MYIVHYIYFVPWFNIDKPVKENFDLYDENGEFVRTYDVNPNPELPIITKYMGYHFSVLN